MIDNEDGWAHFNVRCPVSLRVSADEAAKKAGQSLAEWVRRAMQEKLERDKQQEIVRLQAAALADENKEKRYDDKGNGKISCPLQKLLFQGLLFFGSFLLIVVIFF